MIVISGKHEKSKHLENIVRAELFNDKVVIVDAVGVNYWSNANWATIWTIEDKPAYKEVIEVFENEYEALKVFDWICFYVNSDEESIESFKELDRKYPQNFIVTIQSNNGITNWYYV